MRREKSLTVKVDESKCAGCLVCINECPNEAIFTKKKNTASPFEQAGLPSSPQGFNQQSGYDPGKQSTGLLDQVFDFIGRTANTGRGQGPGRGRGLGQGRGCGRGKSGGGGGCGQGRNR